MLVLGLQDELTQLQTEKAEVDEQLSQAQGERDHLQQLLSAEQDAHAETTASWVQTQRERDEVEQKQITEQDAHVQTQQQLTGCNEVKQQLTQELDSERETVTSLNGRIEELIQQVCSVLHLSFLTTLQNSQSRFHEHSLFVGTFRLTRKRCCWSRPRQSVTSSSRR